jgi:hypothetical protein
LFPDACTPGMRHMTRFFLWSNKWHSPVWEPSDVIVSSTLTGCVGTHGPIPSPPTVSMTNGCGPVGLVDSRSRARCKFSRNRFCGLYKLLNFSIFRFPRTSTTHTPCSRWGTYQLTPPLTGVFEGVQQMAPSLTGVFEGVRKRPVPVHRAPVRSRWTHLCNPGNPSLNNVKKCFSGTPLQSGPLPRLTHRAFCTR